MNPRPMLNRCLAEALGTAWLVFGGCGSAVLAATFPNTGIGFAGVSLAFGLTVLTGAAALGGVSGGHFNPAVTLGLAVAKRHPWGEVAPYAAAQVIGGALGALLLFLIASGSPTFSAGGFAANGYGELSPGGYSLGAAFLAEAFLTAMFLVVILGSTADDGPKAIAPISIGLSLTLIHLVSIPVTNTSVNPARSTAVVFFAETGALSQLWLFWVAPLVGAALGGLLHGAIASTKRA